MIVELFVSILAGLVGAIGNMFPDIETPGFLTSIAGHVSTVVDFMAPLGNWIPFGPAGTATAVVLVAFGVSVLIRLIRIVVSLFTGGGGSAA